MTKYTGKYGQDIIIADMDDYHLANAFNYFGRQLYKAMQLFNVEGYDDDDVFDESIIWLKCLIYSLGMEAAKRGRKNSCKVCGGTGITDSGGHCLMCCGTGWYLGQEQKELNHARKEISVG